MEWFISLVLTFVRLANALENGKSLFAEEALEFAQWTGLVAKLELYIAQTGNAPLYAGAGMSYDVAGVLARYNFLYNRATEVPYVLHAWHVRDRSELVVMAMLSSGKTEELFRYFSDEYSFRADDFRGYTVEAARRMKSNESKRSWGIEDRCERVPAAVQVQASFTPQNVYDDLALEF